MEKLGCSRTTLREWCIQAERDAGERSGWSSTDKARIKELERENKKLRTANAILKKATAYFARAELDRPFADDRFHRKASRGLRSQADLPR